MELYEVFKEVPWAAPLAVVLAGFCVGSFLNVCIWRMPRRESVVFAPSHCPKCGSNIKFYDNIPIISFLILGGKCRKCKEKISPRYWLVELMTGLLALGIYLLIVSSGGSPAFAITMLAALPMMIAGAFIDVEHGIIPDQLTVPTAAAGIILAAVFPGNWVFEEEMAADTARITAALLSAAWMAGMWIILSLFAFVGKKIFKRNALGGGDVKYMAAIAALAGPGALITLAAGSAAGAIYGIVRTLGKDRKITNSAIRFAPWLGFGFLIWCIVAAWMFRNG